MTDVTIEAVQEQYPQWRVDPRMNPSVGPGWLAQPWDEMVQPPVFEYRQLIRGLSITVVHADPLELGRRIAEQDRLRREMHERGERPFSGRTYVEREARKISMRAELLP